MRVLARMVRGDFSRRFGAALTSRLVAGQSRTPWAIANCRPSVVVRLHAFVIRWAG